MNVPLISRIHHVHLRVRTLADSARFYTALFQFESVPAEPHTSLSRQCLVGGEADGFGLVLTQGLGSGVEVGGVDHIGLEVASLTDVVTLYRRACGMNARATAPRIYEGHWQFFVFDPDGYKIEVLAVQPADGNDSAAEWLNKGAEVSRRAHQ